MKFPCQNPLQGAILKPQALGGNITQYYGENPDLYAKAIPNYPPKMGHNGIDIAMPWGTPVLAAHDGVILGIADGVNAGTLGGNFVMLHSADFIDDDGVVKKCITGYFHLSKVMCTLNQEVKTGDVIGLEGNTGFVISTATPYWNGTNPTAGSHLHFSLAFAEKVGTDYKPLLNEYGRATIDPAPYLGIETKAQIQIGIMQKLVGLYQTLIGILDRKS